MKEIPVLAVEFSYGYFQGILHLFHWTNKSLKLLINFSFHPHPKINQFDAEQFNTNHLLWIILNWAIPTDRQNYDEGCESANKGF